MSLDSAKQTFIDESRELLAAMEDALLTLETVPGDPDAINAVFRAMHTIKGAAGLFALDDIVSFTHVAESVMDRVRDGEVSVDEKLIALLLGCQDHIAELLYAVAQGAAQADPDLLAGGAMLTDGLCTYLDRPAPDEESAEAEDTARQAVGQTSENGESGVQSDAWHVSVRFDRDLLRHGFDPISFVRYLGTLGELLHVELVDDALPAAEEMDPESCYIGFEIRLSGALDKARIESAFEFVEDDCTLTILPPHSQVDAFIALIQELPEDDSRLGEMLLACGSLTERELEEGLRLQAAGAPDEPGHLPLGEILVGQERVEPVLIDAALEKQRRAREAKSREARAIRVDAAKLDELINLVGELVIAGASAEVIARGSRNRRLVEANASIVDLVGAIRDSALRLRMVEIGETFNRFRRVVRDVAQELGKEIDLVITGADTELDKSVVEQIGDPLMHLVRNAMDHGLESPDVRLAAGKPAKGTLRLNAYHESGSIVIEIADDGGGLDRARILAKAEARGLVQPGHAISEQEIDDLIFEPGFSTAEQVTNLSGRGVGMDVVRRNIEALRGSIALGSRPGLGTTVTIRLPLTLAIIDGFLVGAGDGAFVIPLDCVVECMKYDPRESAEQDYINLRGQVLPFLRLRSLFALEGAPPRRENIVVVNYAGQRIGLVVDRLLGECQTVIKPLGRLLSHLRGFFTGSTILGSGEIAMILDVQELIHAAVARDAAAHFSSSEPS